MGKRNQSKSRLKNRDRLTRIASNVAEQLGRGVIKAEFDGELAKPYEGSLAHLGKIDRDLHVVLYLGKYFIDREDRRTLQFWAGLEINHRKQDKLKALLKKAGRQFATVDEKNYVGEKELWLPDEKKSHWHRPHLDLSKGHYYSWFGLFCDASNSDQDVQETITAFLVKLVREVKSLLAEKHRNLGKTEKTTKRKIRTIQNKFRSDLEFMWQYRCAVTDCDIPEILRASHIKPWMYCNPTERGDPHNGLLLSATHDALFDNGLITFSNNGRLMVSSSLRNRKKLGLNPKAQLRHSPTSAQKKYLRWHREHIYEAADIVVLKK